MRIKTDQKVKIEVYKNDKCVAKADNVIDFNEYSYEADYYKIIPIERFELMYDPTNAELADIYDNKNNVLVAEYLSKDTAKNITKLLNNLNNQ